MSAIELDNGRAAFSQRRWEDAFALLSQADKQAALSVEDLARLGRSASMIGRDDAAFAALERTYELCLTSGHLLGACQAAFWHGFRLFFVGEVAQATAWLSRAEQLVEQHGKACVERGYLLLPEIVRRLRLGEAGGAGELAAAATRIGDDFHDADLSALARQLHGRASLKQGDVAGGMKLLDEAMLIATTGSASELVKGLVYCSVIASCQQVFAIDRAREWTSVLAEWCEAQPQLSVFNGSCRVHRAEIMQINGAWEQALDEIKHVGGRRSSPFDLAAAAYQEAEIHRLRGEYDAASAAYHRASELGGETQPGLALLLLAQGQSEAAAGAIRRIMGTRTDPLQRAHFLPAYVEIMLAIGKLDEAAAGADELIRTARTYDTPVLRAISAHASGEVALANGDFGRALPLLQEVFQIWQGLDAPYLAARLRVQIALAYDRLGDGEGARFERTAARKIFRTLGAYPDLRRLDEVERERRASATGGLSSRELEVLKLAALGKTNKAIAIELGLSERTVDRHISNILTKLDVPSRAAATSYAYQHGMI